MKSNLNLSKAVKVLESWGKKDIEKLIHVVDFCIRPYATINNNMEFLLSIDVYIAGISDGIFDGRSFLFNGSFVDCINQAIDKIEEIREDMRKRI